MFSGLQINWLRRNRRRYDRKVLPLSNLLFYSICRVSFDSGKVLPEYFGVQSNPYWGRQELNMCPDPFY